MTTQSYDRKQILDEVWSTPVSNLAERYDLTDAGFKKLCSRLQIPTPPRGYWAKRNAGKKVPAKPRLREFTGSPASLIRRHRAVNKAPIPDKFHPLLEAVISRETDPVNQVVVPDRLIKPHPLVKLTQEAAAHAYLDQREQPVIVGSCLHLHVSKAMQGRALLIADTLFKAVERRGYELHVSEDGVAMLFHGIKYPLEFYETCTRVPYQMTDKDIRRRDAGHYDYRPPWTFVPSGVLILQTRSGYGPKVQDGKRKVVEELLNTLLIRIATAGVESLRRREEREIKAAEYARQFEAWKTLRERQEAERTALTALEAEATRWERAERLRSYLRAIAYTADASELARADKSAKIDWGNAKADWLDPLVNRRDDVLDAQLEKPSEFF